MTRPTETGASSARPTAPWKALSSLRRVTSDGRYVAEIDGLRFVAIAAVLVYHLGEVSIILNKLGGKAYYAGFSPFDIFWRDLLLHGSRGVQVFFAISGFVLGLPFARHRLQSGPPVRLKAYFLRRITRLEPPYIVNLLIRVPLVARVKHLTLLQAGTHFAVSLLYADWLVYQTMPTLHPPSWSLAIEVQFYVLAPLLAVAVFHPNAWLRRGLSVTLILACSWYAAHVPGMDYLGIPKLSLVSFAQLFLAGMLAVDFYLTVQPRLRRSVLWDVVGIPLWFILFFVADPLSIYLTPWIMLILFPAAFLGKALGAFFRTPAVAVIGGMCYSIYLVHSLVLEAFYAAGKHLLRHGGFWGTFTISALLELPIVLAVATLFYVVIERPCMNKNWPRDLAAWWRRRFQPEPATG